MNDELEAKINIFINSNRYERIKLFFSASNIGKQNFSNFGNHFISMKYRAVSFYLLFILSLIFQVLPAQNVILTSSNDASGNQGSVGYSVGQIFYLTKSGTGGNVFEGIQQPFEISDITGIDDETGITLECIMYPNPAVSFVNLKIESREFNNLVCHLFHTNGRLLKSMEIKDEETRVPLDDLSPGTYFLSVSENNKSLKIFRIIKN